MASDFDPFQQWLGIAVADQPPHFYRLLGLAPFESDPKKIDRAAQEQISKLEAIDPGSHRPIWEKLLQKVVAVRIHLLDAEKKAAYDAKLQQKLAAAGGSTAAVVVSAAAAVSTTAATPAAAGKSGIQPPLKQLGPYAILQKLGDVGGRVFKAQDQQNRRVVAVKVLPPQSLKDADAAGRFNRVIQAAAQLSHPNLVTVLGSGEDQGNYFYAMEYVAGCNLGAWVAERGPLVPEAALDCILHAARGLNYAHGKGVIHRDIKPSKLLIDQQGTVKILDSGLVRFFRLLTAGSAGETLDVASLIASGQFTGTVDYMSPEQAEDMRRADARSDIYSLGCVFFHLLAGQVPYPQDTDSKKLFAHRVAPIPLLSNCRSDISSSWDDLFRRLVAKTPADRFQSMSEVIKALQAIRSPQPTPVVAATAQAAPVQIVPAQTTPMQAGILDLLEDAAHEPALLAPSPTPPLKPAVSAEPNVSAAGGKKFGVGRVFKNFMDRNFRMFSAIAVGMLIAILGAIGVRAWLDQELSTHPHPLPAPALAQPPSVTDKPAPAYQPPPTLVQAPAIQPATPLLVNESTKPKLIAEPPKMPLLVAPPVNEWLDILALVDIDQDPPRHGTWSKLPDGLRYEGADSSGKVSQLPLPLEIKGSYRWQMEFTGDAGLGAFLAFPVGENWVRLTLDTGRNQAHISGLERVNGQAVTATSNPAASTFRVETLKRYLLELEVKTSEENGEVMLQINGQKIVQWKGLTRELSLSFPNQMSGGPVLSFLGTKPHYTIYSAKLQAVDEGTVRLLHPPAENRHFPNFVKLSGEAPEVTADSPDKPSPPQPVTPPDQPSGTATH